jgi:hypothetical protein
VAAGRLAVKTPEELFYDYATMSIDEKGIFPQPGIIIRADGSTEISALALPPMEIFKWFWREVENGADHILFGLDRHTKPNQGTKYRDVLTCVHYTRLPESFRVGVINYQHDPRIVDPMDWDNAFWQAQLSKELRLTRVK